MSSFIGDYICKIDDRGRITLPTAFKKAMSSDSKETFVVKKDIYEKCLILYPLNEWERQMEIIRSKINPYNKEHNIFLRGFFKGTAEIELDTNNRILIPKRMLEECNIEKEAVLAGQDTKIEIWSKNEYEKVSSGEDFARLAERIMANEETKSEK